MITLFEVVSARIKDAVRFIKTMRPGKTDPRESNEISPYGWDSCPIPGAVAVYVDTTSKGDNAIIGYAGRNQICDTGESRAYVTDVSGAVLFNIWLRNNGDCLMGDSIDPHDYIDHLVKFRRLDSGLQAEVGLINNQLDAIAVAINSIVSGTYTPIHISLDISAASIHNIKTP